MLVAILLLAPCTQALPIDSGAVAPCTGIIITTDQAKQAAANRAELKVRRAFECEACPACPSCPKSKPPALSRWAAGGAIAGALATLLLALVAR
tara:strand:- start:9044 stop:9325 length:282 start_codon:yes stop_codon:yes gene_type:complete